MCAIFPTIAPRCRSGGKVEQMTHRHNYHNHDAACAPLVRASLYVRQHDNGVVKAILLVDTLYASAQQRKECGPECQPIYLLSVHVHATAAHITRY